MTEETEIVHNEKVVCEGLKDGIGHPKVYLHIGKDNTVKCPYCSKLFIYEENQ